MSITYLVKDIVTSDMFPKLLPSFVLLTLFFKKNLTVF